MTRAPVQVRYTTGGVTVAPLVRADVAPRLVLALTANRDVTNVAARWSPNGAFDPIALPIGGAR